jgi:hypothetical protein
MKIKLATILVQKLAVDELVLSTGSRNVNAGEVISKLP